jgi:dethiobiotin synthetase
MGKGVFITGTDTGVGKTFVAVKLIEAMKNKGLKVCPMKPVESGCRIRKDRLIPEDTVKMLKASGLKESIDVVNPYRLRHPLAPSIAAEIEGVRINKKKIFLAYNRLLSKYDVTIVEGAGGIMVPIYKNYLFLNLVEELNLPVVIVSRPSLGTINHTLLTIEALKNKKLNILGVIINYSARIKKGLPERTNPEVIEKLGRVPLLDIVPYSQKTTPQLRRIFSIIASNILSSI